MKNFPVSEKIRCSAGKRGAPAGNTSFSTSSTRRSLSASRAGGTAIQSRMFGVGCVSGTTLKGVPMTATGIASSRAAISAVGA